MRAIVQRVKEGRVSSEDKILGEITKGLVVFLGIGQEDQQEDVRYLAKKIINLRIFPDEEGKMNLSLKDIEGEILIVSQFTLYGDCRKGRRPSFTKAAAPEKANQLYEYFIEEVKKEGIKTECGQFQTEMLVEIANDGPVTLILDTDDYY